MRDRKENHVVTTPLNSRERVLRLFRREPIDCIPVFSGMGNITVHGLEKYGWKFPEIHTDARKMASMAASTYELFGFESAVVPFDLAVEAEALGSKANYYPHATEILYPTIMEHPAEKVEDLNLQVPPDLSRAARIPLVCEALRLLKPGGIFCNVEHNPLNPVTRLIVSRTPVDADAQLLRARESQELVREAGARVLGTQYFLLFPELIHKYAAVIEDWLTFVPAGGQYAVFAQR